MLSSLSPLPFRLILFVYLLASSTIYSQELQEDQKKFIDKIVLAGGIGVNYGTFGGKVIYQFNDNFETFVGIGPLQLSLRASPLLGIEYHFNRKEKRFNPFVNISGGRNLSLRLRTRDATTFVIDSERESFWSFNTTAGVLYNFNEDDRYEIRIGVTYSRFNSDEVQEFIDDFNQEFSTEEQFDFSPVVPVVGFRVNLSRFLEVRKEKRNSKSKEKNQ